MLVVGVTLWGAAACWLDSYGGRPLPSGTWDAIVVAGCGVRPDGTASPALKRRTEAAVALWRQEAAPVILLTGGLGDYPPTEAEAAAAHARTLGVPQDALVLERRSTSTEENARFAAELIDARRIVVVSDRYHIFRSQRVFARHFPHVDALGSVPGWDVRVKGALREVLALGYYWAQGRL